jgi:hypothetical protein
MFLQGTIDHSVQCVFEPRGNLGAESSNMRSIRNTTFCWNQVSNKKHPLTGNSFDSTPWADKLPVSTQLTSENKEGSIFTSQ